MVRRFETVLLEGAIEFLRHLEEKPKNKILHNIERASFNSDATLLKKLEGEIWEFRTLYAGIQYRLLAFWDKSDKQRTLVVATHGAIKKSSQLKRQEIDKAEQIRREYFKAKQS